MGKIPCCERNGLKKGPWTAEEDEKLIDYIQKHGHGRWRTLPKNAGLKRCGKSCRLRWTNYLRPDIKRGRFSFEEEEAIIQLHCILGNKWSAIAARLPGRTDNEIKNYWNTHIRKRLLRMGVDPVTHIPRLDLLEFSSILSSSLYNSSQFNIAAGNILGIQQPIMANPNLLNLGTALLSYQHQNPEFIPQNHSKNQLSVPQFESQFQSFPIDNQEVLLNESQLMQANLDHFSAAPSYFISCPNLLQNNGEPSNMAESFIPLPNNYDYNESDQSFINPLCETKPFQSNNCINNIQNSGFGSVLSTPSSSSTPLNSSSTIYANGSTEDERDSYCSNMLMFDFPNNMGVQESKLNEYRMCSNMLMFENQTL